MHSFQTLIEGCWHGFFYCNGIVVILAISNEANMLSRTLICICNNCSQHYLSPYFDDAKRTRFNLAMYDNVIIWIECCNVHKSFVENTFCKVLVFKWINISYSPKELSISISYLMSKFGIVLAQTIQSFMLCSSFELTTKIHHL